MTKRKRPIRLRTSIMISVVVFIILVIQGLWLVNKGIEPTLMDLAKIKTDQFAVHAINDAIEKEVVGGVDIRELIVLHDRPSDKVSYSFNPQVYNQLLSSSIQYVEAYIKNVEQGTIDDMTSFDAPAGMEITWTQDDEGVVYWIPIGVSTQNALLANLGPKIPVRFSLIGDVQAEIDTKISKVGINNSYLELYVNMTVRLNVIIPSTETETVITNAIKIGDLFIEGDVPQFYQSGGGKATPVIPFPTNKEDEKEETGT
ncbi:sporulation protein YunB [Aureibacillus halotolerans]|uniref:Sporulation protein YunB n=1 Tax=Aureibacillus halotolerans TaxID=1508390 RepID=A0A4R6U429_9BACI|nr:sporulation protein YunB [Aureibacillus halotolerans]TDQ40446.1 sporulation protein YunB [Aureibacillus halotolerans]